jgi:transposase
VAIETGELVVVYVDECHLIWDDARGYVWGPANEHISINMTNFRQRQTYYGAIEQYSGEVTIHPASAGDGTATVAFIEVLRQKYPRKRLAIIWDGASYHKGEEMRTYLQQVNHGLTPEQWQITCLLFAPNAPEQNPMEDIWLKGKQFVRKNWYICDTFRRVKELFVQKINGARFVFEKLYMYASCLEII